MSVLKIKVKKKIKKKYTSDVTRVLPGTSYVYDYFRDAPEREKAPYYPRQEQRYE